MKILLAVSASALVIASAARADTETLFAADLSQVVVTAPSPVTGLVDTPTTRVAIDAEAIAKSVNLVTPEDALRYLPNVLIRQRHIGDTQSPVTTRTSGVGASARSLIYVDGMLISSLIGNNNTSASPKWGLVSPDAIDKVEVLYGPFAAAYAGNSIGSVIAFTTRMPDRFEANAAVQGAVQSFSKYGDDRDYGTTRLAADLGDRFGRLAFRLSYNHLDSRSQPLTYATAVVPAGLSTVGVPVTGAFTDANRNSQPVAVLGATAIEHQRQDNLSGRATYAVTPTITAAYSFGLFHNDDDATSKSYLRGADGQPVYTGPVNIAGRAYTLTPATFSGGVYRLDELQLAQGLSLTSHTNGAFDFALTGTTFAYLTSRQRAPSGALPVALAGGAGSTTSLDNTGWRILDATGTWRPFGMDGAHVFGFGAHEDAFRLNSPRYALADWTSSAAGATQVFNRGRTETQALWLQDVWTLDPQVKATLGVRYEHWRAYDGLNFSAAPALSVAQPELSRDAVSPKAVVAYTPDDAWTLKASVGLASRFPTVTELYQTVTVGTQLQTPNPDLRPERALSSEVSVERRWRKASLRLSLFDERITSALLSQTALLPSGATASFVQNVDRTHATGIELVADHKDLILKGLELSGWATYVDARTEKDAAFPAAVGKALPQLPRWRGSVVATYAATSRLDVSLAARYSDRAFASLDNSDSRSNTYQGFGSYLAADAHVRWKATAHLVAGLGVDNLGGRSYFLFHPFPQRTVVADLRYSY